MNIAPVVGGAALLIPLGVFFVYTVVGSLLMLVAIIAVYIYNGATTFDIIEITNRSGDEVEC